MPVLRIAQEDLTKSAWCEMPPACLKKETYCSTVSPLLQDWGLLLLLRRRRHPLLQK